MDDARTGRLMVKRVAQSQGNRVWHGHDAKRETGVGMEQAVCSRSGYSTGQAMLRRTTVESYEYGYEFGMRCDQRGKEESDRNRPSLGGLKGGRAPKEFRELG